MKKISQLLLMSVALLCTTVMMAQVTSSSMSGRVIDAEGPVMGATVIATHTPSGTTYGAITNTEGRYNLPGMRVGGPYSVEVSYIGYGKNITNNIMIRLGAAYVHDVVLSEENVSLDQVVISAKRTKFSAEKTGATTNISNAEMSAMPTINRSISDIARISPYANGMSISGGDGRSTNFTIDGANFNNNFGLSSSLPGGGSPISLDAIEEVQVVIAPFDVRQTNFIGGGINAITKSGTNKFKGSAYTYFTNQDMRGNRIGDTDFGVRAEESTKIYGLTFGGPIIKNKLFFFVNAESIVKPGQVVTWRPSEDGVADLDLQLSRTSIADMERVKQHLITNYGYDPGSYSDYPADETNKKLLVRVDWNINDANKLSVRYNHTKNQGWNPTNGNSTDAGFRNRTMDRISQYSMAFSNSIYSMDNIVNSFSLDLNSRISDKFSNQFLVTYSEIQDARGTNSSPFPFIDIMNGVTGTGAQVLEPYISAGYELFTWNNAVNNNTFTAIDNLTYYLDNHTITGGLSFEHQLANNSYMRNGTGYYRYASIDDFLNQAAPRDFALTYGYDGEKNPNAEVAFNQFGIYLQDEWNINPNFKLSYGIRADYLKYEDNLIRNNAIYDLDFGGRNIDTGKWPDANVQVSPRVGFTWDVKGDQSMKLRGGTGIFSGRLPLVFFTNMPTNSGMVQGSYAATTTYNSDGTVNVVNPALASLAGPMITDVDEMIDRLGLPNTITPEDGVLPRDVNGVDPNFKMPQVWKTSLAFDYEVPVSFPLSVTLESIYTKTMNGVMLKNYNLEQPDATWQRFSGADNRYIYPASADITYTSNNAYVLSNTSKGWGSITNITVNAEPINDLKLMAAYTYTESQEISGMPGSNAASAYTGLVTVNGPHLPELQRSQYVVPSKVMERVKQHLITNYGYDPGSYSDYPADETNKKLLVRVDWNINDANKLSVRYNHTKNQGWNPTNGNSTDAGFRNRTMDRISQYSMAFSNSIYSMDNIVNSFSLDLNSRISDKFSNQFLVTYSEIQDARGTNSSPFPFIDIMNGVTGTGAQVLEPYISAGYELFTWNNAVNNNTFTAIDNLTYYLDNHTITGGLSFEHQLANNSYMRNGTGYYRYASIDDFLNQAAPRDFALTYGYDGEKNPNAEVAFNQFGIYLQDEWNINPNFKLSYGIRADYLKYEDNLIRNNAIYDLDFGGRNIDTGKWPDANVQVSPRVGFTWDVKGDQSMKLRGGTGIFSGRLPLVFFTNMPTNSGMVQGSYAATTTYNSDGTVNVVNPALASLAGPMITDVDEMIDRLGLPNTITPEDGVLPRDVNGVDPNFKMPQVWKTSLAFDYEVPVSFPLSVTLESIYTKTMNGVMLKNYNLEQPDATWQRFSGADNRYIYPASADITYTSNNAYVLSNTSKGWGSITNITVNAEPINDLKLMAAYTYTESQEISGMPGSNAASAYTGLVTVNGPHLPELQRSQYVVPSKVIGSASYKIPWWNDAVKSSTFVNLFYSGYSPNGYSFTYSNDMNGDGIAADLIYIPKERGDINFISTAEEDAFFNFMEQDSYLKANKGKYAEANAARSPWVHSFDLRLLREYYINVGETKNTLQFSLDFINVGNILNSEWGVEKNNNISNNGKVLRYEGRDANNVPSYSFAPTDGVKTYDYNYYFGQTWKLQVGVKYSF